MDKGKNVENIKNEEKGQGFHLAESQECTQYLEFTSTTIHHQVIKKYVCILPSTTGQGLCGYNTGRKANVTKHIVTAKHKKQGASSIAGLLKTFPVPGLP